jgi:hypothetical protein
MTNVILIVYPNVKFLDHVIPNGLDEVWVGLSYGEVESVSYDIFFGEQFIRIT